MEKLLNYIDGKLVQPIKGDYFENIEPAKGEAYSLIPDSDESDVNLAVAAAKRAFPIWSKMSAQRRSAILVRIANLITENLDELAQAESRDNGKPLMHLTLEPTALSFFVENCASARCWKHRGS